MINFFAFTEEDVQTIIGALHIAQYQAGIGKNTEVVEDIEEVLNKIKEQKQNDNRTQ